MATDDAPTREQIEQYARQAGLVNFTREQMDEFERAGDYMRDLLTRLPRDLALGDEPAHIFRAGEEAPR